MTGRRADWKAPTTPASVPYALLQERCKELDFEIADLERANTSHLRTIVEKSRANDELVRENKRLKDLLHARSDPANTSACHSQPLEVSKRSATGDVRDRDDDVHGSARHVDKRRRENGHVNAAVDNLNPPPTQPLPLTDKPRSSGVTPAGRNRQENTTTSKTTSVTPKREVSAMAFDVPPKVRPVTSAPALRDYWQIAFEMPGTDRWVTKPVAWKVQLPYHKNLIHNDEALTSNTKIQKKFLLQSTHTKKVTFPNKPCLLLTEKSPVKVTFLLYLSNEHQSDVHHSFTMKYSNVVSSKYLVDSGIYEYSTQRNGSNGLKTNTATTLSVLLCREVHGSLRVNGVRMNFDAL